MDRKEFIKKCGLACTGGSLFAVLFQGCGSSKLVTAQVIGSDLVLPVSEFEYLKKEQVHFRSYIVVNNDQLEYPICVFRSASTNYTALWMRCTHQGTELQVFGDKLHCPAHGSEFNNRGGVENGPAANSLRTFPVAVSESQLKISLK